MSHAHVDEQKRFAELCESIARGLEECGITADDLLSTLPEARERVFAKRYPELAEQVKRP